MERVGQRTACLDTHIICWLYEGRVDLLSEKAREMIEARMVAHSAMVELELQYLFEINRIRQPPHVVLNALRSSIGLKYTFSSFVDLIQVAKRITWTRDAFDRLIVADSILNRFPLITKDRLIRQKFEHAIW